NRKEPRMSARPAADRPVRVILLGATGSIGRQTVDVITNLNALHARGLHDRRFEIVGLAAGAGCDALLAQAAALDVRDIALASPTQEAQEACNARGLRLRRG